MLSGRQIRAARGLLGISAKQLAELADVGWATIQRLEKVDLSETVRSGTLERVKEALEAEGVEFIGDPLLTPGVRLRAKSSSVNSAKRS